MDVNFSHNREPVFLSFKISTVEWSNVITNLRRIINKKKVEKE